MKTKGQNTVGLVIGILLVALLILVALFGGIGDFQGINRDSVTLGLDLAGGSRIVYEAVLPDGYNSANQSKDIKKAVAMIQTRLDVLNYTEATVSTEGDRRVVVEIPGTNASDAVDKIGANGVITFELSDGTVVLSSEKGDITNAEKGYSEKEGWVISVRLSTEEAQKRFTEGTKKAANRKNGDKTIDNQIYIKQDGETITSPAVGTEFRENGITGDSFVIQGGFTETNAEYYANLINSGSLPFRLSIISEDNVGATLGDQALSISLIAGLIGILAVMVLMIIVYRLPGLVASVALIGYTAAFALCIVLFDVQLSLPGIAGIILSIGMAVDANVIIYERMKEELLADKTTAAALKAGFRHAFTAILDSNITTLIAVVVLWIFGSGSVKGFAITLFIGILLSMVFAIFVTRYFLARIVGMRVTNPWLYGVSRKKIAEANGKEVL